MSTDQTHDEQVSTGHRFFGRRRDDDDVLEGELVEPEPVADEDPAVAAADDPNGPVDDPIVMDETPRNPEDDRVVLDSHDDAPVAATEDPASPAAAGSMDRDGSYGSTATTGSAIPMPGGPAAGEASPAETTMDDGTSDGLAPLPDATPAADADLAPAAAAPVDTAAVADTTDTTADVPAPRPVPAAETSGTTAEPVTSTSSATADRAAGIEQWHEIKAMFVDDPRAATERAASVVDSRVEALLASVKEQQQSMKSDWQGDGADTEKLRNALQHYRAFWTRLEEFSHQA